MQKKLNQVRSQMLTYKLTQIEEAFERQQKELFKLNAEFAALQAKNKNQ